MYWLTISVKWLGLRMAIIRDTGNWQTCLLIRGGAQWPYTFKKIMVMYPTRALTSWHTYWPSTAKWLRLGMGIIILRFMCTMLVEVNTRVIYKLRGLTLLLRVRNLWRCSDSLFFKVPLLASKPLLTVLHPFLENMLHSICCKLQEDSRTGCFNLSHSFLHL